MAILILSTVMFHLVSLCGLYGAFVADTPKGQVQCFLIYIGVNVCIALVWFFLYKYANSATAQKSYRRRHEAEIKEIEKEEQEAIRSNEPGSPWKVRYATYPCPYCGHYKVRSAKWEDKRVSVAFWGVASSKIGTNFKCEHCNRMWS